jgi:hypothetical protein
MSVRCPAHGEELNHVVGYVTDGTKREVEREDQRSSHHISPAHITKNITNLIPRARLNN